MNNLISKTIFSLVLLLSVSAKSHEGHSELPGQIKAAHGGIVKTGKEMNMEMLATGESIQFFPLPHAGANLNLSDISLTGTAKTPKGKPQALVFSNDGKSFSTKVDLKGTYRADLEIKAQHKNKTDTFKFLVEK